MADTITSYNIKFCEESVIPSKEIRVHPSNTPWVTKDLRMYWNKKKRAFARGDSCTVKMMNKECRSRAEIAKIEYKNTAEENFKDGSAREAWQGLKTMMGRTQKRQRPYSDDPEQNEHNQFYARFDVRDFSSECDHVSDGLVPSPVVIRRFPEITGEDNLTVFSYSGRVKSPEWRRQRRRADLRQF